MAIGIFLRKTTLQSTSGYKKKSFRRYLAYLFLGFIVITVLQVVLLRWINPPTTAFIAMRQIQAWIVPNDAVNIHYQWRNSSQISPYLGLAVIASEDQRFAEHSGFDFEAIQKAHQYNENNKKTRGASTITQQLAKNLFLWQGRSWFRKGLEAWYTILLELFLPKSRILELYTNVVELGDGIYGAEAAAQLFWNIPANQLTKQQASTLAAVLPSPKKYNAKTPGNYVQKRSVQIQNQMRLMGGVEYLKTVE